MIQIFVNNKELLLPSDFTVTITEENPEITSNGEYTLDITLSLLSHQNAIAFEHLNRVNKTHVSKNADGMMIIDGQTRFGKIIVIKNTDVDVTFQFIAGNSQFNYKIKDENKKIWDYDWGTEDHIDFAIALSSNNLTISRNFICTPVLLGTNIANEFTTGITSGFFTTVITGVNNIIMQPYLLYYILKLPTLLGYTLTDNILLTDVRLSKMYLVNSVQSLNYADALPDMTVSEFIQSIESFFNVQFIINSVTKEMSIKRLSSSVSYKKTVSIDKVLDSYIRDCTQDRILTNFGFTKIQYDLTDNLYFKYQSFSKEIIENCVIKNFDNYTELRDYAVSNAVQDEYTIFRDTATGDDYFYGLGQTQNLYSRNMGGKKLSLVNKFRPVGDIDDTILNLKIVPAEIVMKVRTVQAELIDGFLHNLDIQYQLPKSSLTKFVVQNQGITSVIETGEKIIKRNSNIGVSLAIGLVNIYYTVFSTLAEGVGIDYPFSCVDYHPEYDAINDTLRNNFESWLNERFIPKVRATLRLDGSDGVKENYRHISVLDSTLEYTFMLEDSPDVNINNIFIIDNAKYIPISFEREKSNTSKTVKGKFYKML